MLLKRKKIKCCSFISHPVAQNRGKVFKEQKIDIQGVRYEPDHLIISTLSILFRTFILHLQEHFFSWAEEHFGNEEYCFQQDSAPAHKANETQEMLAEECPDFITRDE